MKQVEEGRIESHLSHFICQRKIFRSKHQMDYYQSNHENINSKRHRYQQKLNLTNTSTKT
jgi:hypothetical protein